VTGKPIKFIGVGEKLDKIEEFHPDRMAGRILGMAMLSASLRRLRNSSTRKRPETSAEDGQGELRLRRFPQANAGRQEDGGIKDMLKLMPAWQARSTSWTLTALR